MKFLAALLLFAAVPAQAVGLSKLIDASGAYEVRVARNADERMAIVLAGHASVVEDQGVKVAVTSVKDVRDAQAVPPRDLLDAHERLAETGARDDRHRGQSGAGRLEELPSLHSGSLTIDGWLPGTPTPLRI